MITKWRIERRVPLMVIVTLLLQAIGAIAWATRLDARVTTVEQQGISGVALNEKLALLQERMDNVKQNLEDVKHQLNRLTDRLLK